MCCDCQAMSKPVFKLDSPTLQIGFAIRLVGLQKTHLQLALRNTVAKLNIAVLDSQLGVYAPPMALQKLASLGLRAEILFATPLVLTATPTLLTYYRTLLGYSQKEFYKTGSGLGIFRNAEDAGYWRPNALEAMDALCHCLNQRASGLLLNIEHLPLSQEFFSDLSLLSIGPQLRGGNNNVRGEAGIDEVFKLILKSIAHIKPTVTTKRAVLKNAAGRRVVIELAADPDVVIREESPGHSDRPLVAIEVKAGTDISNIHNRIGEAEKSHLKAKGRKFTECWTIVNVSNLDMAMARQQSPTTNRFFKLAEILTSDSVSQKDFIASIVALTGIRSNSKGTKIKSK